mmetsp:Transcript_32636/g.76491  ORF Transcript_32636/g.76491 Transcript_32636/m.76491 type:complete len:531 (-) Transcript_32636:88-1680(-)
MLWGRRPLTTALRNPLRLTTLELWRLASLNRRSQARLCTNWEPPGCDCYALLAVPRTASSAEIRQAYLSRAKQLHPDMGGKPGSGEHDPMVQLNLCYEALMQRRAEYDAKKGVGSNSGGGSSRASHGAQPWWSRSETPRSRSGSRGDEFDDFFMDWEETFYGGHRRQSWQQWADQWRSGVREEWGGHRSQGRDSSAHGYRKRKRQQREEAYYHEDFAENAGDMDDSDDEERFSRRRSQRESAKSAKRDKDTSSLPPSQIWLSVLSRGRSSVADGLAGRYRHLGPFNRRPSFEKLGKRRYYLFWSAQFRDWKISERLSDDGVCTAFAEDGSGRRLPWHTRPLRWSVWDPEVRSYSGKKLLFEPSGPPDTEDYSAEADDQDDDSAKEDSPAWSRAPWEDWTVADLLRWCERHNVEVMGCFDRESLLERMQVAAAEQSTAGSSCDSEAGEKVQIASRMKTDGSYTRRPTLDRRSSLYGNRVERFSGSEREIMHWLQSRGDKSRLYGIFLDGEYSYSIVWKRNKQWGRLNRASD